MLCGYDFSNHHVPVHLGYIFLFTIKFVFVVSTVCSLLSDNRKLFWERRLWRGSNAVKMQQWLDDE